MQLYDAIEAMRRRVGAGALSTGVDDFLAVCDSLDPAIRRCLDPAVAAREAADCTARVEALPPAERKRVRGLLRGAEDADPAP